MENREIEIRSLEQLMSDLVVSRHTAFSHNKPEADYIHRTLKQAQNRYKEVKGHYFVAGIDDSWKFELD